ncbi:MarR family winged helix-turn-helix transcriptional regulator [Sphingosinicella sp. CPCC 101087]|uniref:MarR family winged helix-turn-helix transcriptional regulator n=1 Tax=Sphingosinicella sp. CPCC 101087 TaxID=2497754 RepID=UPI00101B8368|nr:MarR family winged helix-turn-helix transcriptional regulator [Sphingosinicella sp. CPCC 101087]
MDDPRELGDPGRSSFTLDQYPFYLLNRVVSRYNAIIGAELRKLGIDIPTWRVLMILGERAPRGIAEIAQAGVINISTMTRIIQRMTRDGLTECKPLADDARVTEVRLSAHGEEKLAVARAVTAPVYKRVIKGFSRREFEQLIASLNRLHDNLGQPPGEG